MKINISNLKEDYDLIEQEKIQKEIKKTYKKLYTKILQTNIPNKKIYKYKIEDDDDFNLLPPINTPKLETPKIKKSNKVKFVKFNNQIREDNFKLKKDDFNLILKKQYENKHINKKLIFPMIKFKKSNLVIDSPKDKFLSDYIERVEMNFLKPNNFKYYLNGYGEYHGNAYGNWYDDLEIENQKSKIPMNIYIEKVLNK